MTSFLHEMWSALGTYHDQITAIAELLLVVIAVLGLKVWRKELKGRSEYDRAKRTLTAVYKLRKAFRTFRLPIYRATEYPQELVEPNGLVRPECRYDAAMHFFENRWSLLQDAYDTLEAELLEDQVEWGSAFDELLDPFTECKNDLWLAILHEVERYKPDSTRGQLSPEELGVLHDWTGIQSESTAFTGRINEAVQDIEKALVRYIRR